ncbi:MAG: PD-(D/E)XK nuclease superfamily protein [Pyrinomonadaceae bacterium]
MPKNLKATQGGRAVKTGNALERVVLHALNDNHYTFFPPKQFLPACCLPQPLYTKQIYAMEGIYGYMLRHDFMLYHPEKWPNKLIIECKWQQGRGSVDEKYPYNVLNIQEKYSCPAVILLDGAGFRSGAGAWLRSKVDGVKLLHVFSMMEFQTWVNNDNL